MLWAIIAGVLLVATGIAIYKLSTKKDPGPYRVLHDGKIRFSGPSLAAAKEQYKKKAPKGTVVEFTINHRNRGRRVD